MLSLTAPIKTRLQALPALTGWAVRTNAEDADRATVPAADLRCLGASVEDRRGSGVLVSPEWTVTLVVRRSATAAQEIDAALAAVIEALHGWMPGQQQGRGWEPLALTRISEPMLATEGLVGYELAFSTAALYRGQD